MSHTHNTQQAKQGQISVGDLKSTQIKATEYNCDDILS